MFYYETVCPSCSTSKYSKNLCGDKLKNSVFNKECPNCKEIYQVSKDTTLLTFMFNEEYIKQIEGKGDTNEK